MESHIICIDNTNIFNSENFCIIEQYVRLNFELYIVIVVYTTSKLNFILNLYYIYVFCVILKRERERERDERIFLYRQVHK